MWGTKNQNNSGCEKQSKKQNEKQAGSKLQCEKATEIAQMIKTETSKVHKSDRDVCTPKARKT